jgi:hypothetical protein
VTDEMLSTDDQAPRPTGGGVAAVLAPEGVAAILAVVVVVALLASRLSAGGGIAVATPSPSPTPIPTATPLPGVPVGTIHQLLAVDAQLALVRSDITEQLAKKSIDLGPLQTSFRRIAGLLTATGEQAAGDLAAAPVGSEIGQAMVIVYGKLREETNTAASYLVNDTSAKNLTNWTSSAKAILATLALLPDLDTQLTALLATGGQPSPSTEASLGASPTTTPSPPSQSVAPSPSAAVSPTPVPVTPPPPTVTPSVAPPGSPGASPVLGPNLIQDGAFETGVGQPWQLVRSDPAAAATVSPDTSELAHKVSAKILIQAPSNRAIGLAYLQSGFTIEAGAYYRVSIALRSADLRPIRIRIADSATGQLIKAMNYNIGATWTVQTFDFTTLIGSDFAVFSIDVGESGETVWVDDVLLARIPPV